MKEETPSFEMTYNSTFTKMKVFMIKKNLENLNNENHNLTTWYSKNLWKSPTEGINLTNIPSKRGRTRRVSIHKYCSENDIARKLRYFYFLTFISRFPLVDWLQDSLFLISAPSLRSTVLLSVSLSSLLFTWISCVLLKTLIISKSI